MNKKIKNLLDKLELIKVNALKYRNESQQRFRCDDSIAFFRQYEAEYYIRQIKKYCDDKEMKYTFNKILTEAFIFVETHRQYCSSLNNKKRG